MGHSTGDGVIVLALAALGIAYLYFRHRERQRRMEIVHEERIAAMDKGIPLPELPLDPPKLPKPPDPRGPLIHGIVWLAFGAGAMVTLRLFGPLSTPFGPLSTLWPLPLPLALLGGGLILFYVLASERAR